MNFLLQIDDAVVLRVHNSLNIVALLTSVLVVTVCFYLRSQSSNEHANQGPSVSISLEAFDRDLIDVDALAAGVAEAASRLPDDVEVRFVVTGSFEETVRTGIADPVLAGLYTQERVRGAAVARVIDRPDGSIDVVIDVSLVEKPDASSDAVRRVFAHEAEHIAIRSRGEDMHYRRKRLGLQQGSARGMMAGIAGILVEEFRVERALTQGGMPPEPHLLTQFPALIEDYRASLVDPLHTWQTTGDIEDLIRAVLEGFEHVATVGAYVFAADVASAGQIAVQLDSVGSKSGVRPWCPWSAECATSSAPWSSSTSWWSSSVRHRSSPKKVMTTWRVM